VSASATESSEPALRNQRESLDAIAGAMIANAETLYAINANLDRIAAMMETFMASQAARTQPPMPPSASPFPPSASPFPPSRMAAQDFPAQPGVFGDGAPFMRSTNPRKRFGQ